MRREEKEKLALSTLASHVANSAIVPLERHLEIPSKAVGPLI